MLAILEALVNILAANAFDHDFAVRIDVDAFIGEVFDLVLLGTEHGMNLRVGHPCNLGAQSGYKRCFRFASLGKVFLFLLELALQLQHLGLPLVLDALGHLGAGDLVDADQHGLGIATILRRAAWFDGRLHQAPALVKVLHEIRGNVVQVRVRGEDRILPRQFTVELFFLLFGQLSIGTGGVDAFLNPFVQIRVNDSQLLAPILVVQRQSCTV